MSEELQNQLIFQLKYNQLIGQYSILAQTYQMQTRQNLDLYHQVQSLMKTQIELLQQEITTQATLPLPNPLSPSNYALRLPQTLRRSPGDSPQSLNGLSLGSEARVYKCPYPQCSRSYGSSVSLNLHIKLKHNGGTKKERQSFARMIIEAQDKGKPRPYVQINFPPGFLEEFRKKQAYARKYNM